ncbi:E4 orf6/7 [Simian adenovirus 20]|uniref:E4 ORF6/7 n=1 Tax=Simian adenovirus 20 TaxID=585059 RepID=F6KSW1_9ADEN|nr:E4 ORF6/7 [Simian adenovirus 20]AEF59066.1 E4 orf6/7 [Simian adenovirus 20]
MAQRVRRYRCRLNPYQEYPLAPSENAPETLSSSPLPDCNMNTMHDMTTVDMEQLMKDFAAENSTVAAETTDLSMEEEALDSCFSLSDFSDGLISVTDSRLACQEPVWILTPKSFSVSNGMQLFTAERMERVVYKIKWRGGGGLTVRVT